MVVTAILQFGRASPTFQHYPWFYVVLFSRENKRSLPFTSQSGKSWVGQNVPAILHPNRVLPRMSNWRFFEGFLLGRGHLLKGLVREVYFEALKMDFRSDDERQILKESRDKSKWILESGVGDSHNPAHSPNIFPFSTLISGMECSAHSATTSFLYASSSHVSFSTHIWAWRRSSALLASRSPRARPSWIRANFSTPFNASFTLIWEEPVGALPDVSTSPASSTSGRGELGSSPSDCVRG